MNRFMGPGVVALFLQTLVGCGTTDDPAGAGSADEPLTTVTSALTLTQSFETGWGGFVADHHLLCEPGCGALQWSLVRSTSQAHTGSFSLAGTVNGSHDDGTIWAERSISVPSTKASVQVGIEFYLRSPVATPVNTWPVVAYAGVANPEKEGDFTIVGQTDQVAGWKKYSLTKTVALNGATSIWVAFGFGVTWEVTRTYYLDSVTVTVN